MSMPINLNSSRFAEKDLSFKRNSNDKVLDFVEKIDSKNILKKLREKEPVHMNISAPKNIIFPWRKRSSSP